MTDAEIIKALECCKSSLQICRADCPLLSETECNRALRENVLDLIDRQKAEIERLEAEIDKQYEQAEANVLASIADGGKSCHWCIEQHKFEAIREFAKRLNEKYLLLFGPHDTYSFMRKGLINEIIKEMTEDSNE